MTLRKLSAAVLASVLASGAMAQPTANQNSADSTVSLTIERLVEVTVSDFTFATNSSNAATEAGTLCTYINSGDFTLDVASTNGWTLDNGANTITYTLALDSDATALTNTTYPSSKFANSATACSSGGSTEAVTATITEDTTSKPVGTYTDTVTFTINAV